LAATVACRYGVNGDGTATDYDTGLQWEQKTLDGSVHDRDAFYTWTATGTQPDGTTFTVFLGSLNNGTSSNGAATRGCFAGHCDWRLPEIEELAGIVDSGAPGCGEGIPCIDQTVFGPTTIDPYWSATTFDGSPTVVWVIFLNDVAFGDPLVITPKNTGGWVRAVRARL
jgi:hypothetical protein